MSSTWEDYKKDTGIVVKPEGEGYKVESLKDATASFNQSSSDKPWVIDVTSVSSSVKEISTGSKADTISIGGKVSDLAINTSDGNDTVELKAAASDMNVNLGAGSNKFTATSLTGNSVVDASSSTDDNTITVGFLDPSSVISGSGDDDFAITSTIDSTIVSGAGKDSIFIDSVVSGSVIDAGAGDDTISIKASVNESSVYGGDGNDVVDLAGGGKDALIDLGAGNDTIYVKKNTTAYTDFSVAGGAGKDVFVIDGNVAGVTITDYDATEDVIINGGATGTKTEVKSDGTLIVGGSSVNVAAKDGYYAANVSVGANTTQTYVWGTEDGSLIDASSYTKALIMDGTANDDAVDTLMGGTKADTIYVGKGDYVYGGAGRDSISISGAAKDTREYIALTADGGKDTVDGFITKTFTTNKDADDADVVYLFQDGLSADTFKLSESAGNLEVKDGKGSLTLNGVSAGTTDVELNVMDNSGNVTKVDYVKGTAAVDDTDEMSNVYYSGDKTKAAINFSKVDSGLVVDLDGRDMAGLTNTNNTVYYGGFTTITGGSDNTVLMGAADNKETLIAGSGNTTLWGGGSKADQLTHSSGTNSVVFYYGNGDGKDSVTSGNWGNDDESDILWLSDDASVATVKNNGTSTAITLDTGDKLTLTNYGSSKANSIIKFSNDGQNVLEAKIGASGSNSWSYVDGVDFYVGGKKNKLTVDSSVDKAEVWLDNAHGVTYENVTTIDASSNTGSLLVAGTTGNESLIAGKGNTTLWGGTGNDTLVGNNTGTTEFYFGKANGKDVITKSNSDDKVVLFDVALNDVASADYSSGTMKLNLTDGSSLTVQNMGSSAVNTFQLSDGSQWTFDTSSQTWSQKA